MSRFKRALKHAKSRRRRQKKEWKAKAEEASVFRGGSAAASPLAGETEWFPWGCTFCMDEPWTNDDDGRNTDMSLYNMLFGRNPASQLLLAMLDLTEADVGRFRDCFLTRGTRSEREEAGEDEEKIKALAKKELRIVVYTRNGGGNREDYEAVTERLQGLPTYETDYDDDFDCTYASYEFKVPEAFKATAEELATLGAESKEEPMVKFKRLIDNLQKGDTKDPAVVRAMEVGKQIFGKIDEQMKQGGGKVEV